MKKKQLFVLIIAIVLAALVAASIALPILIINNKSAYPQLTFAEFDQLSDMAVKVEWKKISKAKSYDIEYCYGNPLNETPVVISGLTENTFYMIERKKGTVCVRARASYKDKKGEFSPWKTFAFSSLKLTAPYLSISNTLLVEWSEVKYKYYDTRKSVPLYSYDINIRSAVDDITGNNVETNQTSVNIFDLVMGYIGNYEYTQELWDDLTITFSVKALNYYKWGSDKIVVGEYEFVHDVYEESDYAAASYTMTFQDYKRLKGI